MGAHRLELSDGLLASALIHKLVGTEKNTSDTILFKVKRHPENTIRKGDEFGINTIIETLYSRDTITNMNDSSNLLNIKFNLKITYFLLYNRTYLFRF